MLICPDLLQGKYMRVVTRAGASTLQLQNSCQPLPLCPFWHFLLPSLHFNSHKSPGPTLLITLLWLCSLPEGKTGHCLVPKSASLSIRSSWGWRLSKASRLYLPRPIELTGLLPGEVSHSPLGMRLGESLPKKAEDLSGSSDWQLYTSR